MLILPAAQAPTASKASMRVTSFSEPSSSLTQPGMMEPAYRKTLARSRRAAAISMPGQGLVAAGQQDGAVDALCLHDGFHGVGDDFAGDQGEVHALVAHGDAVGNGDGAELHGEAAAGVDAFLGALGQPVQRQVAGSDFVPGTRDADLGLGEVVIAHADGPEHAARRGGVDAVGDDPAAGLDVRLGSRLLFGCRHSWVKVYDSAADANDRKAPLLAQFQEYFDQIVDSCLT